LNAGRDPLTGQRLAGSIGNPSCWADTTPLSSSFSTNEINPENDNGEDDDDDEDLLFYDGQLAERAVDLLGKLMATSTINVVDDKDRDGGDGSSSTTVEKEEVSAPPWYLAVGFHLPHTPWVVPRRDWEANQKHARQRSSSSADTKTDTKNQQHASDDEKVGLDLMTPAQTLPPIGMPPLAGCAGKGCLPSISFVNTTYQPSSPSSTTTTTTTTSSSSSSSEVVRLESPRDFDPWRPLDDPTQAFLRGRCVGCANLCSTTRTHSLRRDKKNVCLAFNSANELLQRLTSFPHSPLVAAVWPQLTFTGGYRAALGFVDRQVLYPLFNS
jgi:hypothetical protein